jgi:hypothetical protein
MEMCSNLELSIKILSMAELELGAILNSCGEANYRCEIK